MPQHLGLSPRRDGAEPTASLLDEKQRRVHAEGREEKREKRGGGNPARPVPTLCQGAQTKGWGPSSEATELPRLCSAKKGPGPHPPGEASVLRAAHGDTTATRLVSPSSFFPCPEPSHPPQGLFALLFPAPIRHRPGTVPSLQSTGASCTPPPSTAQEICHKTRARFGFLLHLIAFPAHPHLPLRAHPAAGAQHPASAPCAPNGSGRGAVPRASASPYKSSQKAKNPQPQNHKGRVRISPRAPYPAGAALPRCCTVL